MYTRDQIEEQLKANAKSALFEREFMSAFSKHLNDKREGASKPSSEKKDWKEYQLKPSYESVAVFKVEGDDETFHYAKWQSLMKDAAFYFDLPTVHEEREIRKKLQIRYDDILPEGWRSPL